MTSPPARNSRALLEALFQPASKPSNPGRRDSATSIRSSSSLTGSAAPGTSSSAAASTSAAAAAGAAVTAAALSQAFKPVKPSSLAASASGQSSDEDEEEEEEDSEIKGSKELADRGTQSSSDVDLREGDAEGPKAASTSSSLGSSFTSRSSSSSHSPEKAFTSVKEEQGTPRAGQLQDDGWQSFQFDLDADGDPVADVLSVLQDGNLDEEDKIDEARSKLEKWINRIVPRVSGYSPSALTSTQLDNLVLDLLHRYREDQQPTGRTFPGPQTLAQLLNSQSTLESPTSNRRPPPLRSASNAAIARPWTPSRFGSNLGSGSSVTGGFPGPNSMPPSPGSSRPGTPTRGLTNTGPNTPTSLFFGVATDSDPIVRPSSRSSVNSAAATGSGFLSAGAPLSPTPAPSSSSSSAVAMGVIGSGSPRGSPRPWNRPLPNSSSAAANAAQSSALSGSPSSFSSSSGLYAAAIASGLGNGAAGRAGGSHSSRPQSPLPQSAGANSSPRLNIGAVEFKPGSSSSRSASSSVNHSPMARHRPPAGAIAVPAPPWITGPAPSSVSVHSTSSTGSNSDTGPSSFGAASSNAWLRPGQSSQRQDAAGGDEDDEDEDEFSPFATAASKTRADHGLYSSGNSAASDTGRSEGDMEYLEANPEIAMTPFDVLCSILIGHSAEQDPNRWTREQVDEALSQNNWDVELTMTAVMANGGKPLPPRPRMERQAPTGPGGITLQPRGESMPNSNSLNPKLYFTPGQKGHARGGASGVAVMSNEAFAMSKRPGAPIRPAMTPRSSSGQSSRPPAAANADQVGAVGASRVCRYYLAGECRRADCRFSHDLGRAICRFWLKGQCMNDPCSFLHDYDVVNSLASGIASSASIASSGTGEESLSPETPPASAEDFPSLGLGGEGAWAKTSGWSTPPKFGAATDSSRTRFAQALQRRNISPALASIDSGDRAFVPMHPRNAPTRAPPVGPTGATIPTGPRAASRIALRAPTLLPTLSVGRGAASNYMSHRGAALQLSEHRNRALAKASEAWKRGDGAGARKWSQEAASLNARLAEESKVAADAMIRERHADLRDRLLNTGSDGGGWGSGAAVSDEPGARGLRGKLVGSGLGVCLGVARKENLPGGSKLDMEERVECLLDLHGLHSKEAVELAESFLLGLERENIRGLAYLAVGQGRHSSTSTDRRHVRMGAQVKNFLASWSYPYADFEGVVIVDPLSHQ